MIPTTIAAIQLCATPDVDANLAAAERLVRQAAERGAAMALLPEAFAFLGPEQAKLSILEPLPDPADPPAAFTPGPILVRCQALARETGLHLILGGFHERAPEPDKSYNACVHLAPDGAVLARYRKIHLFDVSLADGTVLRESSRTLPGTEARVTETPFGGLGLTVCYDLRFPYLYQRLADLGAVAVTVPSAFTRPTGAAHWHVLLRARAIEAQCYVIAPAQHGRHWEKRSSYGHTLVVDPWGEIVGELNTNENPYPPSPAVQQTLAGLDARVLRTYPRPTADPLRDRLALKHGLTRDHVIVTHGGDEGLRLAMTTFVDPGATFAMAEPSYSLYTVLAQIQDAAVHPVELDRDWALPGDTAARLNGAGARLTCLVNPHAPSGRLTPANDLVTLARSLDGVLLVDEAYVDFVDPELRHDLTQAVRELPNLLLLRTFSKGYGLAGLRLGYLLGHPELIAPMLWKTRDSYNVDAIAQALGEAALHDRPYAEWTWDEVRAGRRALHDGLSRLGLAVTDSQANFVLAQIPADSRRSARELYEHLKAHRILVRYFDVPRLDRCLRISVGTPEQNQRLIEALEEALPG